MTQRAFTAAHNPKVLVIPKRVPDTREGGVGGQGMAAEPRSWWGNLAQTILECSLSFLLLVFTLESVLCRGLETTRVASP